MIEYVQNILSQQPTAAGVVGGTSASGNSSPKSLVTGARRRSFQSFVDEHMKAEVESTVAPESEYVSQGERRISTHSSITGGPTESGAQTPRAIDSTVHTMILPLLFREDNRPHGPFTIAPDLQQMLNSVLGTWRFDVFKLAQLCDNRPLLATGRAALLPYSDTMGVEAGKVDCFLASLEERYHSANTYHNAIHAADITNTMLYWIRLKAAGGLVELQPVERIAALCAAAGHDVGHNGKANRFHVSAETPLAMLFNDQSVLENMHCAITFVVLHHDGSNIISGLEPGHRATFRTVVVEMILATDLAKHLQMVTKFKQSFLGEVAAKRAEEAPALDFAHRRELLAFTLKASDVAGSSKPFELHAQWTMRIMGEFFSQGDAERELGLPCSPFCDRHGTNVSESQTGFFDFIVTPLYSTLSEYLCSSRMGLEVLPEIGRNREFWKRYDGSDFNYRDPCSNWDVLRRAYVAFHAPGSDLPGSADLPDAVEVHLSRNRRGSQRILPVTAECTGESTLEADDELRPVRSTSWVMAKPKPSL